MTSLHRPGRVLPHVSLASAVVRVLACAASLLALAAPTLAGTATIVDPVRVSAEATLNVTATGLDAAPSNNRVTFTIGGASQAGTVTSVVTADAARGLRRLSIRVPSGLGAGTASLRIVNQATGEETNAGTVEIVVVTAVPDSGRAGAPAFDVVLDGTPNTRFVAGATRVSFGAGVSVSNLRVDGTTRLTVAVTIAATAAPGPRSITVLSSGQAVALPNAFSVLPADGGTGNRPPSFTSSPVLTAAVATQYRYQAAAVDPDGDPVTFALVDGPVGLDVSSTGLVSWTPATTQSGARPVTIEARDGKGGVTPQAFTITVASAPGNQNPTAAFSAPGTGQTNQAVAFDASASSDPDNDLPLTYSWNFGDGSAVATGVAPSHTFTTANTFTVTLTVTDARGGSGTTTKSIVISAPGNQNPTAAFSAPGTGQTNQAVAFDASASADPDNDLPLTYSWNFGDGSAVATGVAPSHTFATANTFTVTLTVTDARGGSGTTTKSIVISAPGNQNPTAAFSAPGTGQTNQAVAFDASASADPDNDLPLTYSWNFGDGSAVATGVAPSHTFTTANTFTVTLTVTDARGGSGTTTKSIVISAPGNQNPTAAFSAPGTGQTNQAVAFDASASSDPDNDLPLTYSWNFGDGSAVATGVAPSHTFTTANTFTVTLTVTDARGGSGTTTKSIVISAPGNQNPTAAFSAPGTGQTNQAVAFDASASSDPDNDLPLTYSWNFGDGSAVATGVAPSHTFTTANTFTVTLTVTDARGGSGTTTKSIVISAPGNQNPTAAFSAPGTGQTNQAVAFDASASADPDNDLPLTYSWNFGDGSAVATGVAPSHTFTTANTFTVTLTVTDARGGSGTTTKSIVISAPGNQNPTAAFSAPGTGQTNQAVAFDASASADPDNDLPLTYSWNFGDGSAVATGVAPSHTFTTANTFTVTLTVTDARGGSATTTKSIVISAPGNQNPTAAFSAPGTGQTNQAVAFDASASSDPDNDLPLTYSWNFGDGSAVATGVAPSHTFTTANTFTVTLTVTDARGGSATTTKSIVISAPSTENHAPVFTSTPLTSATAGQAYSYQATATDADNDAVVFSLVSGPNGMTVSPSGLVQWTPQQAGNVPVSLLASDGKGGTAPQSYTLAVVEATPTNLAPVVSAGPDVAVTLPASASLVGSVTDTTIPAGKSLTMQWSKVDGPGTVQFSAPTAASTQATFSAAGLYTLQLSASDGELSASDTVAVTVNSEPTPTNNAPTASVTPLAGPVTLPAAASLVAQASDDGRPNPPGVLSFQWTVVSWSGGSVADTSVAFKPPSAPQTDASFSKPGTYVLRLTVSDGEQSASADVTVVAQAPVQTNVAPTVDAGLDADGFVQQPIPLTGHVSDDGHVLSAPTVAWSLVNGPGQVVFSSATSPSTTVTVDAPGTYVLALSANDGEFVTSDQVSVAVSAPTDVTADRAPPILHLTVPATAAPGAGVDVIADASDNMGVASVRFEVDGQVLATLATAPYLGHFTVPQVVAPGTTLLVRALARDAAGNEGHAEASVTVSTTADLTTPTVQLNGPQTTSPGATIKLVALATDDVGVQSVGFNVSGADAGLRNTAPYVVTYLVPADAQPGTTLTATARAVDAAGNAAETSLPIQVVADADTTPPTVSLAAPAEAYPGTVLTLSASASDQGGIALVTLDADGATIASLDAPPYSAKYTVPLASPPGAMVNVQAVATDFAALTAAAAKQVRIVAPPLSTRGIVTGEAYDDGTGLPLANVTVKLAGVDAAGVAFADEATTDARGRYLLRGMAGTGRVTLSKAGWSRVDRAVTLVGGSAVEAFDARLTKLDADAARASVAGVGGLPLPSAVQVTFIGQQGLEGRLAYGWSPVGAVDVAPHATSLSTAAVVHVANDFGLPAGDVPVLVRFDEEGGAWRVVGTGAVSADGLTLVATVAATGQYAFVVPDAAPAAPPPAVVGSVLAGVTAPVLPAAATSTVTPAPTVLFYQPGVFSDVKGVVNAPAAITSGLPLAARITESYAFRSGAELRPEPYVADLVFYQVRGSASDLAAAFRVTPSQVFDALDLQQGVVSVEVIAPGAPVQRTLLTPQGGTVDGPNGTRLLLAPGAVADATPVDLALLAVSPLPMPDALSFVSGLSVSVPVTLARGAVPSVPLPAGLTDSSRVLLVRVATIEGQTRLVLAGLGRIDGDRLVGDTRLGTTSTPLEGVTGTGQYLFLKVASPIGFAGGVVTGVTNAPFPGALVSTDTLPIVSLSTAQAAYFAVGVVGTNQFTARDLSKNDTGSAPAYLAANAVSALPLHLVAVPPTVTSISPVNGSTNVPLGTPIVVTFSEAIDPVSVSGANLATLALTDAAGGRLDGAAALSQGNTVLTFRPTLALLPNAHYSFTVGTGVKDLGGYALAAPVTVAFDSLDTLPPPTPAAGSITAGIPTGGMSTVTASQGTAAPTNRVFVDNLTSKVTAVALVNANGSFSTQIAAAITDKLRVRIVDATGNETTQDLGVFKQTNQDGSVSQAVGADGGTVDGPGGVQAKVKPGTFPDGAVVTINKVAPADLPIQLTDQDQQFFTVDGGVSLDFDGAIPQKYIDISIAPIGGETVDTRWLVTQVIDIDGQKINAVVDTGKFRNDRITTASPPCPGVQAAGTFGLIRSQQSVGVSYARVYTGYGGALMFGLGYYIVAGLYHSPFAVYADRFADALCFPAFSASVTLTQNTTQVTVPGSNLAPADRVLKFRNINNSALPVVSLGRDVVQPVVDVVGEDKHSYRVVAKGVDTVTGLAAEQLVTRFTVAVLEPAAPPLLGRVRLRIDPDPLTLSVTSYEITNLTLKQQTVSVVTTPDFKGKVPGGNGEKYEVKIVDVLGRERTLGAQPESDESPFGKGNLVFHAEPGALDPTREELNRAGRSGPARTYLILSSPTKVVSIQNDLIKNGGGDVSFDGNPSEEWTLTVKYDQRADFELKLPRFQIQMKNAATGKVLKTVAAYAAPPSEPQGLPDLSDDDRPPYVISGPSRLHAFDPGGELVFTFNEAMDASSLQGAFVLVDDKGQVIDGTVQVSGQNRVARFIPSVGLKLGRTYTLTIKGKTGATNPGDPAGEASGARDRAGNVMPQVTLRIEMFTPTKVGEWGDGTQSDLFPPGQFTFGPIKDVVVPPRTTGGPPTTTVFATTGAPVTNLIKLDLKDPAKIKLLRYKEGDISRQKLVVVPRVAFTQRNGTAFTGDVVATTTFNPGYSAIDIYDVTQRSALFDDIAELGRKVLTENPDNVGFSNRHNTVFADGLAKGISALVSSNGLALYAAVERVGVMAVDAGKNSPQLGIGSRIKEGLFTGDFTDLTIENGQIFAVSRSERRMVVLNPDLSLVASYVAGVPVRKVKVVSGFTYDADADGFITPEETYRLAFLACDDGIKILDITNMSQIYEKGTITTPGIVKDLDIDVARRRAFAIVDKGTQLVTMIDVTDPTGQGLIDHDDDKVDDRIVWQLEHPGPNSLKIDSGRGLLLIAGAKLEVYAAYDICCDLGVDMTAAPSAEVVGDRKALLLRERKAMQQEIKAGLDKAAKDCGLRPTEVKMLESGSGACIWDGDPANTCGSAYQPGLSDHDISMFFEDRAWSTSAQDGTIQNVVGCTIKRLADRFIDPDTGDPKKIAVDGTEIEFEEITFLPNRLSELLAARYGLDRTDPTLPGDAVNDGALGRQLLVLRHVLEGRWLVRIDGWPVQGVPFDDILTKLREQTKVAALEGHEYAKLMEFALAKASVYIRVKGASDETSYFNAEFIKQLHSAGKAGIRATLGRIVADDRARALLMGIRRTRGTTGVPDGLLIFDENACLLIDAGQFPEEWQERPCTSLEDYIASTAGRTLRMWRGDPPINLFTKDEVVNAIARFYRVKADLEIVDDEAAADAFIASAHRFVTQKVLPATQAVYTRDLPTLPFEERTKRQGNLTFIQGKLGAALLQGKLKAVPRVFNKGFTLASKVSVQMWLQPGDGAFDPLPKIETEVTLEPSSEQFLKYKRLPDGSIAKDGNGASIPQFSLDAVDQSSSGPASAVVFSIDLPGRTLQESNRDNNVGGFFYYILDVSKDAPTPPSTAARVPTPFSAEQMKPDEKCKPDRQLLITQRTAILPDPVNGPEAAATRAVSPATLYTKWHAIHFITVTNPDPAVGVTNAVLCNTLTGACTEPFTLAAGGTKEISIAIPTDKAAVYDVIPTVFSPSTGIQRGGPFRIIISCAQFTISALSGDSNEVATVMRGGTSYRYFRVTDNRKRTPASNKPVKVSVEGVNAQSFVLVTDGDGNVGTQVSATFTPGVPITFTETGGVEGSARVNLSLVQDIGEDCAASASYPIDFVPFELSHSMKAGSGISGSKVKALGVTLTGSVVVGMGVSATEKRGDRVNPIPFSLSRSLGLGFGLGEEFSLFKAGAEVGPFTAKLQGPTVEASTELKFSFGDTHAFNDALNLTEQDRYAILLFAMEPTIKMRGSFWLNKLYEVAQKKLVGRPRLVSQSVGASAGIKDSFSLVEAAMALERKQPGGSSGGGTPTPDPAPNPAGEAPAVGFKLDVKGSASESIGINISRSLTSHTLGFTGSFGGAFGLEAELELPAALARSRQSAAVVLNTGDYTPDQRDRQLDAITQINLLLSNKFGGSASLGGSISVGTTTADYTDLASVPVGTSLLPQSLDLGFSLEGGWGWTAEGGLPAQNREHGESFSFSYSAAAPDIKKKALSAFNFFRAGLYPAQKQELGVPAIERISLQPTSLFDDFGRFLVSMLPDSSFSLGREIGTGISFPIGLEAELAGTGGKIKAQAFAFNQSVGYTYQKGVLKNGRAFIVEDYAGRNVALNFLFDAMFREVQQLFQVEFNRTMKPGVLGKIPAPTPEEHLDAFGPNPGAPRQDPVGGPSLSNPDGKIEMTFASQADADQAKALLSFDFETVPGPVEPYAYRPIQASGPDGKPHYGVTGFHHFEPPDAVLSAPAHVVFNYDDDEVDPADEPTLGAYRWVPARLDWEFVPGTLDQVNNTFVADVSTLGVYTLAPTMPAGFFQWNVVGVSRSGSGLSVTTRVRLRSTVLRNNAGGPAKPGEFLHVFASLPGVFTNTGPEPFGAVVSADADPNTPGVQVATGEDGTAEVEIELPGAPATIQVNAFSNRGTAISNTQVGLVVP